MSVYMMPTEWILATVVDGDEHGWLNEQRLLWTTQPTYMRFLMQSISTLGVCEPIYVGNDNRLWDGHHRLLVAASLGVPYVPVRFADG